MISRLKEKIPNLKESKKFLQISLGVSTQYDEQVMANVDSHQLALRSEILGTMSEFTEESIQSLKKFLKKNDINIRI